MKIYRCIVGALMVFFIIIGVLYVVSFYNEQRSTEDGILIRGIERELHDNAWSEIYYRGDATCHR